MVHFSSTEVQQLLHNKFVVVLGDSIQRAVYKDLVLLLQKDSLLTEAQLKAKGELSFEQDRLVSGGQLDELHNGTHYREVRQFLSSSGHHLLRFYFLTRVYSAYVEDVLTELKHGPPPDVVIMNSCVWDLSRYGRDAIRRYQENLECLFERMEQVLPASCLLVWTLAMPLGKRLTGGFLLPELQPMTGSLRVDVLEANFYCSMLADGHHFDVLDLHFHFRHAVQHRCVDGIHWDQHAHRRLSQLLLAHVAEAWGVEVPCRSTPFGEWSEEQSYLEYPDQRSKGASFLRHSSQPSEGTWSPWRQPAQPSEGTWSPWRQPAQPSEWTWSPWRQPAQPSEGGTWSPWRQPAQPSEGTWSPWRQPAQPPEGTWSHWRQPAQPSEGGTWSPWRQPAQPSEGTWSPWRQPAQPPEGTWSPWRQPCEPSEGTWSSWRQPGQAAEEPHFWNEASLSAGESSFMQQPVQRAKDSASWRCSSQRTKSSLSFEPIAQKTDRPLPWLDRQLQPQFLPSPQPRPFPSPRVFPEDSCFFSDNPILPGYLPLNYIPFGDPLPSPAELDSTPAPQSLDPSLPHHHNGEHHNLVMRHFKRHVPHGPYNRSREGGLRQWSRPGQRR